ncbi:hypothetical protein [Vibrio owensii]|uniref:Uncharacterized protein n=1 Tax=Vibrio owensii CAIM 1854 = LMG 25443 TaxID=1229493 RepID=A0A0C1Z7R9_9VIBR|nr:hypothetical protein [Vibrio owensii]KIF52239.1 hypothetical protein H735_15620 [Vibrio owensii CAIM 1854 = LMG 25443]
MTRKTNNKQKAPETLNEKEQGKSDVQSQGVAQITHHILQEGKALKLSPKSTNHVFYEIGRAVVDGELYVRLVGNEGGGLHSKEWIKLTDVLDVLAEQEDKPFKSSLFKTVFKGGSANNAGFLAACIRGMGLTIKSETSVFLHVVAPEFDQQRTQLLALSEPESDNQ